MNSKIISINADLIGSQLKIEAYKHNDETRLKRKRPIGFEDILIPTEYDLTMVDKKDKKHIQGILRNLLGMTTMEFTSEIKTSAGYYDLQLKDIECLNIEYIAEVVQKYRAFITETVFDYPHHQMIIQIRRNDTPITSIRQNVSVRKKLKVR
jgi:hypothetical protein